MNNKYSIKKLGLLGKFASIVLPVAAAVYGCRPEATNVIDSADKDQYTQESATVKTYEFAGKNYILKEVPGYNFKSLSGTEVKVDYVFLPLTSKVTITTGYDADASTIEGEVLALLPLPKGRKSVTLEQKVKVELKDNEINIANAAIDRFKYGNDEKFIFEVKNMNVMDNLLFMNTYKAKQKDTLSGFETWTGDVYALTSGILVPRGPKIIRPKTPEEKPVEPKTTGTPAHYIISSLSATPSSLSQEADTREKIAKEKNESLRKVVEQMQAEEHIIAIPR